MPDFDLPKFSDMKRMKFIIHAALLVVGLSLVMLIGCDVYSYLSHNRIKPNLGIVTIIMVVWTFWVAPKERYRK